MVKPPPPICGKRTWMQLQQKYSEITPYNLQEFQQHNFKVRKQGCFRPVTSDYGIEWVPSIESLVGESRIKSTCGFAQPKLSREQK